jgi:multidrug efflux system outer membrane protein
MTARHASMRIALTAVALAALAGCSHFGPPPERAAAKGDALQRAEVPGQWAAAPAAELPALGWRERVRQPQLLKWVDQALAHNRDVQVAVLSVQRAQAQLVATDAARLPSLGVGLGASRAPNSKGEQANTLTAGVQMPAWEIDLFGRLASLSDAARAQLAASEAGQRAAELSVVGAVLQAALALQADDELLALARQSLDSREQTLKLSRLRESVGAASQLELQGQITLAAQARATLAQLSRQRAQDANALGLLLGQPATALPATAGAARLADEAWVDELPAALPATVLLRRPDVVQAEQTMRAAQANIGAARAAFWPSITLTAQGGQVSSQLSGLFEGGHFAYTVAANALLTVFDAGRRQANLAQADVSQQIAQAQYERAIQSAFREVADGLAGTATWREQGAALQAQAVAARETARLTRLKAQQGAASVLEQLEAERGLWTAEQAVLQARLGELNNRVALLKALGG